MTADSAARPAAEHRAGRVESSRIESARGFGPTIYAPGNQRVRPAVTLAVFDAVAIVILTAISGFFSSSELAVFSVSRHRIDALAAAGAPGSAALKRLRADPHRFLVTALVSNNVANIATASVATAVLVEFLPAGQAATGATAFTSFFVIVFGEFFDRDETDPVRVVVADTAVVNGWATVDYVNDRLGLALQIDGTFETVAGLVNYHTGRLAEEGDPVELGDAVVTVLDATQCRVRRVRIDWTTGAGTADDGSSHTPGPSTEDAPD